MPAKPATARQLAYLKHLAAERGQSFTWPISTQDATREISRLKKLRPDSRADQRRERHEIANAIQAGPRNSAAHVRGDEMDGYGASAVWARNRTPHLTPDPDIGPARRQTLPVVGERVELGRYEVTRGIDDFEGLLTETRQIIGQRVNGVVRLSDVPASGIGRYYLIERELQTKTELDALVADYLWRAQIDDRVPMSAMTVRPRPVTHRSESS